MAQLTLGGCYTTGQGVERDYAEALKWNRKSAEQNYAWAQYNLGSCYYSGRGVEKDVAEAVKWWRKAAEKNYVEAQKSLGFHYAYGKGVKRDYAEAYAWYNLVAKTDEKAAKACDVLEKSMSPQQVAAAKKRTEELCAQIEANLNGGAK